MPNVEKHRKMSEELSGKRIKCISMNDEYPTNVIIIFDTAKSYTTNIISFFADPKFSAGFF